jgi:AcrR family transcriptional regulator
MRALTARGQATRDKVVSGARQAFEQRGFAAARVGDIADAAGVAHGTVYTYFDTKEDVLLAVLDAARHDLEKAMTMPAGSDPIARVEAANRAYLDGYRAHALLLRVAEEASAADERFSDVLRELRRTHVARVAAAIGKLQNDGLAAPDLDAHTASAALCGMVEGFAAHWLGRGEAHEEELATRTLTQLWVRSLGMPARIAVAEGRISRGRITSAAGPMAPSAPGRPRAAVATAASQRPAGPIAPGARPSTATTWNPGDAIPGRGPDGPSPARSAGAPRPATSGPTSAGTAGTAGTAEDRPTDSAARTRPTDPTKE